MAEAVQRRVAPERSPTAHRGHRRPLNMHVDVGRLHVKTETHSQVHGVSERHVMLPGASPLECNEGCATDFRVAQGHSLPTAPTCAPAGPAALPAGERLEPVVYRRRAVHARLRRVSWRRRRRPVRRGRRLRHPAARLYRLRVHVARAGSRLVRGHPPGRAGPRVRPDDAGVRDGARQPRD